MTKKTHRLQFIKRLQKALRPQRIVSWFKKKRVWIPALLGFLLLGFLAWQQIQTTQKLNAGEKIVVAKGPVERTILRSGRIQAEGVIAITPPANGLIQEVLVANGAIVAKGQELFKIQSTATPAEQADAWSNYLKAQKSLSDAKIAKDQAQSDLFAAREKLLTVKQNVLNLDARLTQYRDNPLANRPDQTITENEIEAIRSTQPQAEAIFKVAEQTYLTADEAIQAAQAAASAAWLKYQATTDAIVTAPANGTIANAWITIGSTVSLKDTRPAMYIVHDPDLVISLSASETDIIHFKPELPAKVTVDAYPDKTLEARVRYADTMGQLTVDSNQQEKVSYTVLLVLNSQGLNLSSGMLADVEITLEKKDHVLRLPNTALQYGDGESKVRVLKTDKKVEWRNVKLGIRDQEFSEIIEGLSEGETVLAGEKTK